MHRCNTDSFHSSAAYEPSSPAGGRKYFKISDDLPKKYRSFVDLLWREAPKLLNSSLRQKISVIETENELATHLKQFKQAIPKGLAGKFSCFVFDNSCTFLSVMHYGDPNSSKKYHELCFYAGQIDFLKSPSLKKFHSYLSPSRTTSEISTDLDDAEEIPSSDDELNASFDLESPESYQESDDEYEKSMTVRDKDGYNFMISTLPSLRSLQKPTTSKEVINPQFHAQVCGTSDGPNEAIQILFQTLREFILSGYHDE